MYPTNLLKRVALVAMLLTAIVALFIAYPGSTLAQGGGTSINAGDVVDGELGADGTATFSFDAQAGDLVHVQVFAFDFVPSIEIQTAGSAIATGDMSTHHAALTYVVAAPGEQTLVVSGNGATTGRFGLSLALVDSNLPAGVEIASGQSEEVALSDTAAVYRFAGDENSTLILSIRSRTAGFQPDILLLTDDGEVVAEVNSTHLSGAIFALEPGVDNYILIVSRGTFVEAASVEVSLSGGALGLVEVPDAACYVTASTRINVRAGGSLDHEVVAVMGAERYLQVIGFNPANDTWYQVQLPDGRTGWVAGDVVALINDCSALPEATYEPVPTTEGEPTTAPEGEATTEADGEPTAEPTVEPTVEATVEPTIEPTVEPTLEVTAEPTTNG